jgi:membrane protease YdiL (CAAX protease family)
MPRSENERRGRVYFLTLLTPILGLVIGVVATLLFQVRNVNYSNLVVNLFFLIGCTFPIWFWKYSKQDLGLAVIDKQIKDHTLFSLVVFSLYILFYIFVIRINGLKPITSSTIWGLVTYAVVVFTEELYFRGILYRFLEAKFSGAVALVGSSVFFGLIHAQQSLGGVVSRTFSGWLWGSIRYSTGMIFLLIFPIHFAYNSIWLLFEGNWTNPPTWAPYVLPALEFLLGFAIVIAGKKFSPNE